MTSIAGADADRAEIDEEARGAVVGERTHLEETALADRRTYIGRSVAVVIGAGKADGEAGAVPGAPARRIGGGCGARDADAAGLRAGGGGEKHEIVETVLADDVGRLEIADGMAGI